MRTPALHRRLASSRCLPLAAMLAAAPAAAAPPAATETLLVMPLKAESGLESAARALDELMLTAMHRTGGYRVLGPADLNALLGVEQMKDAAGCDEVSCAAEIGGALGAPFLVAGQLARLGDQVVLSLRLMDTRVPTVLERASARGGTQADALARMLEEVVGTLFHTPVAAPATTVAPPAATDYSAYTRIVTELGKLMSRAEYTQLLAAIERYEKETVAAPPNTDFGELLAYYRVTACFMLKRLDCVRTAGAAFLTRWGDGMYATGVQSFLDQLETAAVQQEEGAAELAKRVAEIQALERAGNLPTWDAQETIAMIYFGAQRYAEAADRLATCVEHHIDDPAKMIGLTQSLATALEQAGQFDRARQALERAQEKHPKQFRAQGLQQVLRRLPR